MRRATRILLAAFAILVAIGLGIFFFVAPPMVEDALNPVESPPPYPASEAALALHKTLVVADLHADPLLWGRDLLERGTRGHVDIPRLAEGNVALQVFGVVTQSPRGLNIERNDNSTDDIFPLAHRAALAAEDMVQRQGARALPGRPAVGHGVPFRRQVRADPDQARPRHLPRAAQAGARHRRRPAVARRRACAGGRSGQCRSPVRCRLPHDLLRPFLRQRDGRLGAWRREGRADRQGPRSAQAHGGEGHHRRSVAWLGQADRGRAGHGDQAGRRLAYRRARHLRQQPQPFRRPAARHRRQWRDGRHRLLGDRDLRQGCDRDRQRDPLCRRHHGHRPCRARLRLRRLGRRRRSMRPAWSRSPTR